jgi:hypothetical protein
MIQTLSLEPSFTLDDYAAMFREGDGPPSPKDYEIRAPVSSRVLDDIAAWIKAGRCST